MKIAYFFSSVFLLFLFWSLSFSQATVCESKTDAKGQNIVIPPDNLANGKCFTLPKWTHVRVSLDTDVTAGFAKRGDLVQFIVLENVYADQENLNTSGPAGQRIVVIPKDTKFFGVVDFAQNRTLFYGKGKSKLFVFIRNIRLESGSNIPIEFTNTEMVANL